MPTDRPSAGDRELPCITLALPDGPLRQRMVQLLEDSQVEVRILSPDDLVDGVQGAEGGIVVIDQSQLQAGVRQEISEIAEDDSEVGVAVIGEDRPGERARLLAAGFSGVLSKDQEGERLAASLEALAEAENSGGMSGPEVGGSGAEPRLVDFSTRSPKMREFVTLVERVTNADTTLLILGPTGVGKEHLARAIHGESQRRDGPFVDVNCAALPEQLLEAELFGHTKGAFTGADRAHKGRFAQANGGTIFLDEVGDMPQHLQAKLLTVLQRHEVTPVGSEQPVRIDVRVMVATNRNLEADVASGRFREDLFFRLNVVPLAIPSLAERPQDIPELAGRFIQHFRGTMPDSPVRGISDAAVKTLMAHAWPGNIRELINAVERAMLLSNGEEIAAEDLTGTIRAAAQAKDPASGPPAREQLPANDGFQGRTLRQVRDAAIGEIERAYLRFVLTEANGQVAVAAKMAGLSNRALYDRMKRHDLRKEDFR